MPLDPTKLPVYFATVQRLVRIGGGLAHLTPTALDDEALAAVESVLKAVEPFLSEPWFVDLIGFLQGLLASGQDPKVVASVFKAAFAERAA